MVGSPVRGEFVVGEEDGGILERLATMDLPVGAADGDADFDLAGGADGFPPLDSGGNLLGEFEVFDVEKAVGPDAAEEETGEVLVALFGVHDAVLAGVRAVGEGAGRGGGASGGVGPVGGGVGNLDEAVTGVADGPFREVGGGGVVGGVGADEVEDAVGGEVFDDRDVVVVGRFGSVEMEVVGHPAAAEVVDVAEGEPAGDVATETEIDAVVGCGVGEELVDGGAGGGGAVGGILEKRAADETAHGVGDEMALEFAGLDAVVDAFAGDGMRAGGADEGADSDDEFAETLGEMVDREALAFAEVGGGFVVVTKDGERRVGQGDVFSQEFPGFAGFGGGEVFAVDVGVVVAVGAVFSNAVDGLPDEFVLESDEGGFEEELAGFALADSALLGGADVEPHVGVGDGFVDLALGHGEATDVDDRVVGVEGIGHGGGELDGFAGDDDGGVRDGAGLGEPAAETGFQVVDDGDDAGAAVGEVDLRGSVLEAGGGVEAAFAVHEVLAGVDDDGVARLGMLEEDAGTGAVLPLGVAVGFVKVPSWIARR